MVVKNQRRLAMKLGLDPATISRYVRNGLMPEPDGGFDVKKCRSWHKRAAATMKAGTVRHQAGKSADERYREAKADMMEDKRAISRGELVSRAEVNRQWAMRLLEVRDGFLYLGRQLAPQLVGRSVMEIQATIDQRAIQILGQLSCEGGAGNKSPTNQSV